MKQYVDTAGNVFAFEDDVITSGAPGNLVFTSALGEVLNVPKGLSPYSPAAPTVAQQIAAAKAAQIALLNGACQRQIIAGFSSSALGTARTYPSADADQRNLLSAVTASQGQAAAWATPIWCANAGTWSFASHTAAQVQQVNADWLAFRVAAQQKYANLIAQVNAATTVAAVQAITW